MGFLSGLFGGKGYKNPADSANKYIDQIPGQTSQYFQPYINAGQNALPQLQGQYNDLLNNPGGKLNQMGGQFQQSPGFQFALQQALQGSGHAAAAGGMAGGQWRQRGVVRLRSCRALPGQNLHPPDEWHGKW